MLKLRAKCAHLYRKSSQVRTEIYRRVHVLRCVIYLILEVLGKGGSYHGCVQFIWAGVAIWHGFWLSNNDVSSLVFERFADCR